MKQLALINPEQVTDKEASAYPVRESVRAIVANNTNEIAILNVAKGSYFKLPGGGIEENEDHAIALKRECMEELGVDISFHTEVGIIVEYRKMLHLKQISYCYMATLEAIVDSPHYTDEEVEQKFSPLWVPYADALQKLLTCTPEEAEAKLYIVPRDIIFLKEAAIYLPAYYHE